MSLVFNSRLRAFSMERIASPDSLFCDMVLRKSFLMSFSFEKERSAEAVHMKMVHMSLKLDVIVVLNNKINCPDLELLSSQRCVF